MAETKNVQRGESPENRMLHSVIRKLNGERGFLQDIAESVSEGILVVDENLRILYRNHAAEQMLGIPQDFSRLTVAHFLKGLDWKHLLKAEKASARHEMEILYPERRIVRFYVVPHRHAGLSSVILSDITEDFDKAASQAESERGKLVSMLAAGVAHEIGNPLNSLYLNLQLLERLFRKEDVDREEAAECLRVSKAEVERLDSIINQFLKALRPAKLRLEPTRLTDVVAESLSFMRHEIEDKSIEVVCDWGSGLLPLIQADPAQLKQAFYNIIKNAIQAMPQGGVIHICCREVQDDLVLSISDTGGGISPETMSRLFTPYFTTKSNGNGIGLMVVERVLREHGAKLSVESSGDSGTTFAIAFPLHRFHVRSLPAPDDTL